VECHDPIRTPKAHGEPLGKRALEAAWAGLRPWQRQSFPAMHVGSVPGQARRVVTNGSVTRVKRVKDRIYAPSQSFVIVAGISRVSGLLSSSLILQGHWVNGLCC
jgi:hypothetical protein